jgi:putative ubiquitin-RnfH superfamily antitoxin RatB of RatAB toxin-antitoxin module
MSETVQVYVCYGSAGKEWIRPMQVMPGTTIGEAIEQSGVLQDFPEINLTTQPVGIYAKKKTLDTVLRERDRIEIYRPLVADPKDSRRKRAAKKELNAAPAPSGTPSAPD